MNRGRLLVHILAVCPSVLIAQERGWIKMGNAANAYVTVLATGTALDRTGATLTIRSDTARSSMFATIATSMPADSFRGRRIRISADIDVRDVTVGASPWLRVDGATGSLAFDNGAGNALAGTASGHREVSVVVPNEATRITFGLLLKGSGLATATSLRLEASNLATPEAPIAARARVILDSAIAIVRTHSLWRDTVSWAVVEPSVRATAAGAKIESDVYPAIRALLRRLGDHHSALLLPADMRRLRLPDTRNPRPEVRILPDSIGYISVPGYASIDTAAARVYVTDVYAALRGVLTQTSCGWVVDLRSNSGGSLWQMLAGLRPLLGEAGLISFVSPTGPDRLWRARSQYDLPLEPALARLDSAHVAVLTGPRTASSGEAVTISFIGRPRTRSFGLPTAGLSTGNSGFPLPDSSMINLTTAVEADRNGVRYGGRIDPDELIPIDSATGDVQLLRAVAWLRSRPSCRSVEQHAAIGKPR